MDVLSKLFKPNEQYIDWMEEMLNDLDKLQDQENFSLTKIEVHNLKKGGKDIEKRKETHKIAFHRE